MVDSVTSYSRNGLRDWLAQRVTAIIIATYAITILSFIFLHTPVKQAVWQQLFAHQGMKIFTFVAVFSVVVHAWIGMWIVYTDYVKPTALRLLIQCATILTLFILLIWCAIILWG